MGMRWSFCAVSKNIAKPFFSLFHTDVSLSRLPPVIPETLHSQRFPSLLLIVLHADVRYVLLVGEHVQKCKGHQGSIACFMCIAFVHMVFSFFVESMAREALLCKALAVLFSFNCVQFSRVDFFLALRIQGADVFKLFGSLFFFILLLPS